jgi:diacylglycerol kinase
VGHKHFRSGLPHFRPFRKLRTFWSGLNYAVASDFSVGSMLLLSCLTVAVCLVFRRWLDILVIFVATGLMLISELLNTAVAELCDFVEPRDNERIGVIKDGSSAAVGISVLVWAVTLAVEVGRLLRSQTP